MPSMSNLQLSCFATDVAQREKLNTDNGPSSETVLSGLITTIVSRKRGDCR
jgi:hypothetical protein